MTEGSGLKEEVSITQHKQSIFAAPQKKSYGTGKISCNYLLSVSENTLHLFLSAQPSRSETANALEHHEFGGQYIVATDQIAEALQEISTSLSELYPNPEDYFDKLESYQRNSVEDSGVTRFYWTDDFRRAKNNLPKAFALIGEQIQNAMNEIERNRQWALPCTFL